MDKSVPLPAAKILDFIGDIEAPKGYGTIYGNNQNKLAVPLTAMTLGDVIAQQGQWTKKYGSSACGRYQFMKATLLNLKLEMGLSNSQRFDPDFQDRLGYLLLKRRGYANWVSGKLSHDGFMVNLAKEWASFPVPYDMQGAHRKVKRGETYYAGDKLNKSLVDPGKVWLTLVAAREGVKVPPEMAPAPVPEVIQPVPVPPVETAPVPPLEPVTKPEQRLTFAEWLALAAAVLSKTFKRSA